jgi:hypothetical protein
MVSAQRTRAMLGVWQLPGAQAAEYVVRPRGLHPGWAYTLTDDSSGLRRRVSGADAMQQGLRVRTGASGRSALLLFSASRHPRMEPA